MDDRDLKNAATGDAEEDFDAAIAILEMKKPAAVHSETLQPTSAATESPVKRKTAKRKRKNERPFYIAVGFAAILVMSLIVFSIYSGSGGKDSPSGASNEPVVPASPEDTTPMLNTNIKNSSGNDIVIPDLYDGLDLNELDSEKFTVAANGFLSYSDALTTSFVGIDVSEHQYDIDWQAVADAGVTFAMIRVGYRGYTAGTIVQDEYFYQNIEGALAAGIKVGVYFFSQAINVEEAVEEADYVLSLISDYNIRYPVAFDWEEVLDELARTNTVTAEELTNCALAFTDRVSQAGYTPLIYFSQMAGYTQFILTDLDHCDFWLAEYNQTPNFIFNFHMWQYSCTGSVPGIEVPVDLNISLVDYSKINNDEIDEPD